MTARDADLATDYADRSLYLSNDSVAKFTATEILVNQEPELDDLFLIEVGVPGGSGITYVMRGYDGTLTSLVYWQTATIDATGSSYTGPGPLSDIVVQNVKGA